MSESIIEAGCAMGDMASQQRAKEALERGLQFDLQAVRRRFIKDNPAHAMNAQRIELEFLRYTSIIAAHPGQSFPMGGLVDDYWHTFLLFTERYAAFCDSVVGEFIHHVPEDDDSLGEKGSDDVNRLLSSYHACFGTYPPVDIWPFRAFSVMNWGASDRR